MPDKAIKYSGTTLIDLWKFVPAGDTFFEIGSSDTLTQCGYVFYAFVHWQRIFNRFANGYRRRIK